MPAYRKASIRDLLKTAYRLDGKTGQGVLRRNSDGEWQIGDRSLDALLENFEGEEVAWVLISMKEERLMETKTCRTCGLEYTDVTCPHCREIRWRLRRE